MGKLWEFTSGGTNNFSVYVYVNQADSFAGIFRTDGNPIHWDTQPSVQAFVDKKRKVQKPQADIGYLTHGTIILNAKAYSALKDFLLQFGQLLEIDCSGEVRYFYNITNLISCIDYEASEKMGTAVVKAEFHQDKIPKDAQIFKDPLTSGVRMYLTQSAKDHLEKIITDNALTGFLFFEGGCCKRKNRRVGDPPTIAKIR
jgi:hypothetical protein